MHGRWPTQRTQGRLRAALFLCAVVIGVSAISGCGTGGNALRSTLRVFVPLDQDVSQRAANIRYASIDLAVAGHGGLLVLAELSAGNAYFQTAGYQSIVLRHGYLKQTRGFNSDLIMTRVMTDTAQNSVVPWREAKAGKPFEYRVVRQWRTSDGTVHADVAQATLKCETAVTRKSLPLVTKPLQRCRQTLVWSNGVHTHAVLWRDPDSHRLWAVHTVAWPGAPTLDWQVARRWW